MDGPRVDDSEESVHILQLQQRLSNLQAIKDDLRHKQEELQRQVEDVQKEIDATEHDVARWECNIKERQNMLLTIVAFPSEILSAIFLHVVGFVPGDHEKTPHSMPLILSSVCRRWRNVVLGDPKLWTHISLQHAHFYDIEPYLTRCAGMPLDISFSGWNDPPSTESTQRVLRTLGKEAHRWRRLQMDVTCVSRDFLPFLSQKRANSFTYIHLTSEEDPLDDSPVFPAFAVHQNDLHTLILVRVPMFKALVAPRLQHFIFITRWDDPPELWMTPHHLWRILSSTKSLQTLHLSAESVTFASAETIHLPHLQHFTVSFNSRIPEDAQLADLLDMISAPSLQVIEFTAANRSVNPLQGRMWDLALCRTPRYPTVATLVLYNVIYHAEDFLWFITGFPDIKILTLDPGGVAFGNAFLKTRQRYPPSGSISCLDKLEVMQMRLMSTGLLDQWWREIHIWSRRREALGFPPCNLEVVRSTRGKQDISVPFYTQWESVVRFEVRFEKDSEGKYRICKTRIQ